MIQRRALEVIEDAAGGVAAEGARRLAPGERPRMADADPAGCEYLVKLDGVYRHCNEPATCQEPGRLRYCSMHGEAAVLAMKWVGKTLRLINFQ